MDETVIDGVLITPLKRIQHPKGDLFHVIKKSSDGFTSFGEIYISTVKNNEIKGWKKHHKMTLNLVVPAGEVRVVIFDDCVSSTTNGKFQEVILSVENYVRLTIPPNLWVAFQGKSLGLNMMLNIADIEHDPEEAATQELDEIYFSWS